MTTNTAGANYPSCDHRWQSASRARCPAAHVCRVVMSDMHHAQQASVGRVGRSVRPRLQDRLGVGPVGGPVYRVLVTSRPMPPLSSLRGTGGSKPGASQQRTHRHRHRHRLNRGGDRHLNRALHDIVLTRWRMCPPHAYIAAGRARGRSNAEIRRALKCYPTSPAWSSVASAMWFARSTTAVRCPR